MIATIYLTMVAAGCAGMGIFLLVKRIALFVSAKRAIGSIVRWEPRGLRTMHYYPVVTFGAEDGKEYEFVGGPGFSSPRKSTTCVVLYPANHPQGAMNHSVLASWAAPLVFLILASAAGFVAGAR